MLEVLGELPDEQLWLPALMLSAFDFPYDVWWKPPPELFTGKRRRAQTSPKPKEEEEEEE